MEPELSLSWANRRSLVAFVPWGYCQLPLQDFGIIGRCHPHPILPLPGGADGVSCHLSPQPPVLQAAPRVFFGSNISLSHSQPLGWITSQRRGTGSLSRPQPIANAHSMIQVPGHPMAFSCLRPHKPLPPASLSTHPPCASLSNGPRHRSLPHARSPAFLPRMGKG